MVIIKIGTRIIIGCRTEKVLKVCDSISFNIYVQMQDNIVQVSKTALSITKWAPKNNFHFFSVNDNLQNVSYEFRNINRLRLIR